MGAGNTWDDATIDRGIGNRYYTVGDAASHGGIDRLNGRAQGLGIPADRGRVAKFLGEQVAY
jgi:hypothetical protein